MPFEQKKKKKKKKQQQQRTWPVSVVSEASSVPGQLTATSRQKLQVLRTAQE
jgi:hypothetical protein